MYEVHGLFPTPFMRAAGVLPGELVSGLIEHFSVMVDRTNNSSPNLTHTALLHAGDSPLLVEAAGRITPLLGEFGTLLFGERLARISHRDRERWASSRSSRAALEGNP
jgi:hypothetical protein